MFEDSTFESFNRIQTRSRDWMIATFALNGAILLLLVLIPLIYPLAIPQMMTKYLMNAPSPQVEEPKPQEVRQAAPAQTQIPNGHIEAPRIIPKGLFIPEKPEPVIGFAPMGQGLGDDSSSLINPWTGQTPHPVVVSKPPTKVRVSGPIQEGLIIRKTQPVYPPIALAAHVQGTVVLEATISKTGTIENLHVMSGNAMLQQAALDAVRTWRYRPYLLNNDPVEVETTVNVTFKLSQ